MKRLISLALLVFFVSSAYGKDGNYDVEISSGIKNHIKTDIINEKITIVFNNKDLYNDQIKFSYHIFDKSGNKIQYENERIPLILGKDGIGYVSLNVPLSSLNIHDDVDDLYIELDLIDEKNLFWFNLREDISVKKHGIVFTRSKVSNPKEMLKSSVTNNGSENKMNSFSNIKDNILSQYPEFVLNIFTVVAVLTGLFILRKKREKKFIRDLSYSDNIPFLLKEPEHINSDRFDGRGNFFSRIGEKLLASSNVRLDGIISDLKEKENAILTLQSAVNELKLQIGEKTKSDNMLLPGLHEKADELLRLVSERAEYGNKLLFGLHEKADESFRLISERTEYGNKLLSGLHEKADESLRLVSERAEYCNKLLFGLHEKADESFRLISERTEYGNKLLSGLHEKADELLILVSERTEYCNRLLSLLHERADKINKDVNGLFSANSRSAEKEIMILNNAGLIVKDISNKLWPDRLLYRLLYKYYIDSIGIEEEFALFNDIPYEFLADKISAYKDVCAIGQTAKEFVTHIGRGNYIRNIIGSVVDISGRNTIKLCPTALIGMYAGRCDSVVVINPFLSMVLIRASNIIDELKDKIKEVLLLPVKFKVPHIETEWKNFSSTETDITSYKRWGISFEEDSILILYNNTAETINVTVNFSIYSPHKNAMVAITAGKERIEVGFIEGFSSVSFYFPLKPGRNDIVFAYSGSKCFIGKDPRELKFELRDCSIIMDNGNAISKSDIYGYCVASAEYEDSIIRKRLHAAGFFEIRAQIIANKGFYVKDLPSSYFRLAKNYEVSGDKNYKVSGDAAGAIRSAVNDIGRSYVSVLYSAYRKKVMNNG